MIPITYSVTVNAVVYLSVHLLIPVALALWLWRGRPLNRVDWLIRALLCGSYTLFIYLAGLWHLMPSYHLRFIVVGLSLIAAGRSYQAARHLPRFSAKTTTGRMGSALSVAAAAALLYLSIVAIVGRVHRATPVELSFPLKGGIYCVSNAGGSAVTNRHRIDATANLYNVAMAMQFAVDLYRMDGFGAISDGILPGYLRRYYAFGDTLYSPCDGEVTEVLDGVPDRDLDEVIEDCRYRERMIRDGRGEELKPPVGNGVVVEHEGVKVYMAHLMKGSILVKPGDWVTTGQPLAEVGASGFTYLPHLHIHAVRGNSVWRGEGVPIRFDGRFLVSNDLVFP